MRKRLIIDCDPGLGVLGADVDDNLAVLLALASPEVDVLGVSVTFGNTPRDCGVDSLRRTLSAAQVDLPIYPGATAAGRLRSPTPASAWLIDTINSQPGDIHLLMLGPMGNLAAALEQHPTLLDHVASLTLMAGAFRLPVFAQRGDPNIRWDLPAAQRVLSMPNEKTMISMDACLRARFTATHLDAIQGIDSDAARHLVAGITPWLARHQRMPGLGGFFPWDAIALAWLLNPALFAKVKTRHLALRGRGWRKATLIDQAVAPAVQLPQGLDGQLFMDWMMARLTRW